MEVGRRLLRTINGKHLVGVVVRIKIFVGGGLMNSAGTLGPHFIQPQRVEKSDNLASKKSVKLSKVGRRGYVRVRDVLYFILFWSGLRGPKAYSLWGGIVPSPSIGYDYL